MPRLPFCFVSDILGAARVSANAKRQHTLMKNKTIIGIGVAGLVCSVVGGYYYWVTMRIALLFAYSQGDGSLNTQAWLWFATCCIGIALLLTSGISYFIGERRKCGLSAT